VLGRGPQLRNAGAGTLARPRRGAGSPGSPVLLEVHHFFLLQRQESVHGRSQSNRLATGLRSLGPSYQARAHRPGMRACGAHRVSAAQPGSSKQGHWTAGHGAWTGTREICRSRASRKKENQKRKRKKQKQKIRISRKEEWKHKADHRATVSDRGFRRFKVNPQEQVFLYFWTSSSSYRRTGPPPNSTPAGASLSVSAFFFFFFFFFLCSLVRRRPAPVCRATGPFS